MPRKIARPCFQLFGNLLRATEEPNGGKAIGPAVECLMGCLEYLGMIGKSQLVVGAGIEYAVLCRQINASVVRAREDALGFIPAGTTNLAQL